MADVGNYSLLALLNQSNVSTAPSPVKTSPSAFLTYVNTFAMYYSAFLLVGGVVCNVLALITLSGRHFRGSSMSIYLRLVAVMDIIFLSAILHYFLTTSYSIDMRKNMWSCWITTWLETASCQISNWTLVALSAERVISIINPLQVKIVCSLFRARIVAIVLAASSLLLNSMTFFMYGERRRGDQILTCRPVNERYSFIMTITDLSCSTLAPSAILVILNTCIVLGLLRNRKRIMKTLSSTEDSGRKETGARNSEYVSDGVSQTSCKRIDPPRSREVMPSDKKQDSQSSKRRLRERSLTMTLVIANTAFIVSQLPIGVFNMLLPHLNLTTDTMVGCQIPLIMLSFSNSAMNFCVYFITGSKFRAECFSMIHSFLKRK